MPIIASGASESKTQPTVASHLFGPSDFTLHVQRNVSTPIGNGTADVTRYEYVIFSASNAVTFSPHSATVPSGPAATTVRVAPTPLPLTFLSSPAGLSTFVR